MKVDIVHKNRNGFSTYSPYCVTWFCMFVIWLLYTFVTICASLTLFKVFHVRIFERITHLWRKGSLLSDIENSDCE